MEHFVSEKVSNTTNIPQRPPTLPFTSSAPNQKIVRSPTLTVP